MRKVIVSFVIAVMLVGCAAEPNREFESTSLFGRLSERFQLGSTAETIDYKLQHEDYVITIDAEVLSRRDGEIMLDIVDQDTGLPVENLSVALTLCSWRNPEAHDWSAPEVCDAQDALAITKHVSTSFDPATGYTSEAFTWDVVSDWRVMVDIAGSEMLITDLEVYPEGPRITTQFELINVFLPFMMIALFFVASVLRNKMMLRPLATPKVSAS